MTSKKRNKDKALVKDRKIVGKASVTAENKDGEETSYLALYRSRKARRANARLRGVDWRSLSEFDKLSH